MFIAPQTADYSPFSVRNHVSPHFISTHFHLETALFPQFSTFPLQMTSQLPPEFWALEMADVNYTQTPEDERLVRNVETVQFCVFLMTITVHLTIVWALLEAHSKRYEELTGPFFKLCLATAGVDICQFKCQIQIPHRILP